MAHLLGLNEALKTADMAQAGQSISQVYQMGRWMKRSQVFCFVRRDAFVNTFLRDSNARHPSMEDAFGSIRSFLHGQA